MFLWAYALQITRKPLSLNSPWLTLNIKRPADSCGTRTEAPTCKVTGGTPTLAKDGPAGGYSDFRQRGRTEFSLTYRSHNFRNSLYKSNSMHREITEYTLNTARRLHSWGSSDSIDLCFHSPDVTDRCRSEATAVRAAVSACGGCTWTHPGSQLAIRDITV